jgi:vacuolar protein sorting-associated protein 13D
MTPCSTPPGSPSLTDSPTLCSALSELPDTLTHTNFEQLNEGTLHNKLYDRYNVDFTDLQVLVCKGKERWGFASSKGYSTMHVLDRFCISLQIERRIINTLDPQFPSLTLSGTLPKLNAHVNEQKISALLHIFHNVVSNSGSSDSPFR